MYSLSMLIGYFRFAPTSNSNYFGYIPTTFKIIALLITLISLAVTQIMMGISLNDSYIIQIPMNFFCEKVWY
ncbi:hypothetical protein C9446_12770 [Providencia heimbachae]|nr:hypothetical protein C9446_12770 [Providencia heimbachae]